MSSKASRWQWQLALHHSANKKLLLEKEVVEGTHSARLGQKAAAGTRPAPLAEVAEPQRRLGARTLVCLSPSVPLLADTAAEAVDVNTVHFLLKDALKQLKERRNMEAEEEEEERWMAQVKAMTVLSRRLPRKRKKKRKRKLPRNSSRPRLAARHLGRYGPEGHFCRDAETASVARAVRTWKPGLSTSHWYLAPCSVLVSPEEHRKISVFWKFTARNYFYGPLYLAVICAVYSTTRQSRVWSSPLEYKSMDFSGRRILVWFPHSVLLGSTVDTCLASVYEAFWLPHCRKLRILRSCSSSKVVDIHVFTQMLFPMVLIVQKTTEIPQLLVDTMADVPFVLVVQCWLCRLRCTSRCVRLPGSQAHDARRHGRYGPDGQLQCLVQGWSSGATVEFPQLQFIAGRAGYFPVVAQWPFYGPDCSSDFFLPQVQYTMADVPVVQVELFSWFRR